MQALFYTGECEMQYQRADMPAAAADEALLKVLYCGICGSDRHAYHGKDPRRRPPLILGHEAVGEDDSGARVIINPLITCGQCRYCAGGLANLCAAREMIGMARAGAFAEYVSMPRANLIALPPALSLQDAAFAEPAACAWRLANLALARLPFAPAQARALVQGAGAIGILAALALRICGCGNVLIADTQAARCAAAQAGGLDATLAQDISAAADEYDIVVDAVGAPATRQFACRAAAPGGVIAHIGLEDGGAGLDARRLTLHEIAFAGSYTYTPAEFAATVELLARGAFGDLQQYARVVPLAQGAQAFAELDAGLAAAKIILQP